MTTTLLDEVRQVIRLKHLSLRTEEAYVQWIKRYVVFHHKRHPLELGEQDARAFLAYLAQDKYVSSSTQNQALNAKKLRRTTGRQGMNEVYHAVGKTGRRNSRYCREKCQESIYNISIASP